MNKAHSIIMMLDGRKKDLYTLDDLVDSLEHDQEAQQETKPMNFLPVSKLPPIPIPTFSVSGRQSLEANASTKALVNCCTDEEKETWDRYWALEDTDSEIVLGWLNVPPDRKNIGVLVTNRLKEVKKIVTKLDAEAVECLIGHVSNKDSSKDTTQSTTGGHVFAPTYKKITGSRQTEKKPFFDTITAFEKAALKHELSELESREAKNFIICDHQGAVVNTNTISLRK
ncbi:unnamed protein product [Haemonchus placei]|uniref:PAS domain-containing protein n=1 Tax=Haemonchus placei TaxID=6290 RepID=A0A0N4WGN8_HAEPC|nr:unnamed protein product [Haemonchus placei]